MPKNSQKHAFSLAEALITLLIVCLITIASIPIITKKKRVASSSANGFYICTLNENNEYVEFNSLSPEGKLDDPKTWRKIPGGKDSEGNDVAATHCTFVPPLSGKNFAVTAIGGGGAGGDGKSEYERVLGPSADGDKVSHVTDDKHWYQLTMVGSGGGGGHGWAGDDTPDQTAAGGGAGAYIAGITKFKKGLNLSASWNTTPGQKSNPVGWESGGQVVSNGNSQTIFITSGLGKNVLFQAGGGKTTTGRVCRDPDFWESLSFSWTAKCSGGNPEAAAQVLTPDNFANYLSDYKLFFSPGEQGSKETLVSYSNTFDGAKYSWQSTRPGEGVPVVQEPTGKFYADGTPEYSVYGGGGAGTYNCNGNLPTKCGAENGKPGYFGLDKIIQGHGLGGGAGKMETYAVPNIKGYLKITVGQGGQPGNAQSENIIVDKNGGATKIYYYNKADTLLRQYTATGGSAGGNNSTIETPTNGENSLWNGKGGGQATSSCTATSTDGQGSAKTFTAYQKTGKCLKVLGIAQPRSNVENYAVQKGYVSSLSNSPDWTSMINFLEGTNGAEIMPDCKPTTKDLKKSEYLIYSTHNALTSISQALVSNGEKSIFAIWFKIGLFGAYRAKYCGHVWYCSKKQAKNSMGNQGYTVDFDNGTDFLCMFNQSDENDEAMQLLKTLLTQDVYTDDDFKNLTDTADTLFAKIKNTYISMKVASSGDSYDYNSFNKYQTYWSDSDPNNPTTHPIGYICIQPEMQKETVKTKSYIPQKPPKCTNSEVGSSYGAGGGGGYASNFVGAFGYGGAGAPGAVIIEW